jgi:hypothetical protein
MTYPVYHPGMDQEAWKRFTSGHWTLEQPTEEGTYPTATSDGAVCGPGAWAVVYEHPSTGKLCLVNAWGGYFWSAPFPGMPPVEVQPA